LMSTRLSAARCRINKHQSVQRQTFGRSSQKVYDYGSGIARDRRRGIGVTFRRQPMEHWPPF